MRQLVPAAGEVDLDELIGGLDLSALAPGGRPYVASNFAVTVDGHATYGGRAGPIGTQVDLRMLMRLRALADAVLVGAGTVRIETYGPLLADDALREERQRAGRPQDPLAVIPTRSCELPWDAGLFASGRGEVLILTSGTCTPPDTATPVSVQESPGEVDLGAALASLRADRGIRTIVCEGGPHLHAELIELGLVDELFVTIAPKLAGGEGPGLVAGLPERQRPLRLVWLLEHEGELFARLAVAG